MYNWSDTWLSVNYGTNSNSNSNSNASASASSSVLVPLSGGKIERDENSDDLLDPKHPVSTGNLVVV